MPLSAGAKRKTQIVHLLTRMRSAEEKPMLERLVAVEDSLGPFEWVVPATEPILEVDPWGFILAYEREVTKVEETACDRAGL